MKISVPHHQAEEVLHHEKNVFFSVHSAYRRALHLSLKEKDIGSTSSSYDGNGKLCVRDGDRRAELRKKEEHEIATRTDCLEVRVLQVVVRYRYLPHVSLSLSPLIQSDLRQLVQVPLSPMDQAHCGPVTKAFGRLER